MFLKNGPGEKWGGGRPPLPAPLSNARRFYSSKDSLWVGMG